VLLQFCLFTFVIDRENIVVLEIEQEIFSIKMQKKFRFDEINTKFENNFEWTKPTI
jgi:hypothetical protein